MTRGMSLGSSSMNNDEPKWLWRNREACPSEGMTSASRLSGSQARTHKNLEARLTQLICS